MVLGLDAPSFGPREVSFKHFVGEFGDSIPRPPNVPLLRALWSVLDGIWGLLKGSLGIL